MAVEDIEVQTVLEQEFHDGPAEKGETLVVVQVVAVLGAEDAVAQEILGMVDEKSLAAVVGGAINRGLGPVLAERNPESGAGGQKRQGFDFGSRGGGGRARSVGGGVLVEQERGRRAYHRWPGRRRRRRRP